MNKYIGRIWVSLAVLALAILVWLNGDSLKPLESQPDDSPFLIAFSQLGILYIVALFIERALEVLLKAWRQGRKVLLQQKVVASVGESKVSAERDLQEYKTGTQRRALLLGLTMGFLVAVSGVRLLGPIYLPAFGGEWTFQLALFQFTDIIITAGLIAGGSKTIHELMGLIDEFLRRSRKGVKNGDS